MQSIQTSFIRVRSKSTLDTEELVAAAPLAHVPRCVSLLSRWRVPHPGTSPGWFPAKKRREQGPHHDFWVRWRCL